MTQVRVFYDDSTTSIDLMGEFRIHENGTLMVFGREDGNTTTTPIAAFAKGNWARAFMREAGDATE